MSDSRERAVDSLEYAVKHPDAENGVNLRDFVDAITAHCSEKWRRDIKQDTRAAQTVYAALQHRIAELEGIVRDRLTAPTALTDTAPAPAVEVPEWPRYQTLLERHRARYQAMDKPSPAWMYDQATDAHHAIIDSDRKRIAELEAAQKRPAEYVRNMLGWHGIADEFGDGEDVAMQLACYIRDAHEAIGGVTEGFSLSDAIHALRTELAALREKGAVRVTEEAVDAVLYIARVIPLYAGTTLPAPPSADGGERTVGPCPNCGAMVRLTEADGHFCGTPKRIEEWP